MANDSTATDPGPALIDELARLRARVAELEAAQAAQAAAAAGSQGATRAFLSAALIVVASVLAPISVLAVWAGTAVSQTDRWVEMVAPVAQDPGVQSAIADEVTAAIMEGLDVAGLTTGALEALANQENMPPRIANALPALAAPLTRGIEDFTRTQAGTLVASDRFATVWAEVNRIAHPRVVALLEGNEGGAISAQENQITLNLAPVIAEVRARLVEQGFTLAANIPEVERSFVLVESAGIGQAQRFYGLLTALGTWLPWAALGLFAVGVLLARDRRRALLRGAIGVTVAVLALGVVLTLLRTLYVGATPADLLSAESAGNVFDILTRFLRTSLRATAVVGLLVALAAFVTGPSPVAVRGRAVVDRGFGAARGGVASPRLDAVGRWVHRHRGGLQLATVLAAGFALVFQDRPTAADVLLVGLLAAVVLAVIAFLGRPPVQGEPPPPSDAVSAAPPKEAP